MAKKKQSFFLEQHHRIVTIEVKNEGMNARPDFPLIVPQ